MTEAGRRIVVTGRSASALHDRAARFVNEYAAGETLILAPSRGAADDFARTALPGRGLGLHRLTLTQLAASLAAPEVAELGLAPLSHLGVEALAARAIHEVRREAPLDYFGPVAAAPGFPRALAATLAELRINAVAPEALAAAGEPGRDLARLAAEFRRLLDETRLTDEAAAYTIAAEAAARGSHPLLGLPVVLLDTPVRGVLVERLIAALAARSAAVCAVALHGDAESVGALERALGVAATAAGEPGPRTRIESVRRRLFDPEPFEAPPEDSSFALFSAPGEGLECVEIARRILELDVPFDRVAILLRDPDRYQPLVEEALRRASIPGCFSRGAIRPDPAGRAFLSLLLCAAEGCPASRFAEYLSLARTPPLDGEGAPVRGESAWAAPAGELFAAFADEAGPEPEPTPEPGAVDAPQRWEQLLVDAAVVGGVERWSRRLRGLGAEFEARIPRADPEHRPRIEERLAQLRRLERFALPLIAMLANLPKRAYWGEWLERLDDLARTSLRDPEPVLGVLAELQPMAAAGPVDPEEVYGVLSERLRFLRREPPARRYGHVFVGGLDEARAREFEAVFTPGFAEGLFPRRASEDPLLLDEFRERIGQGLIAQDGRVARERMLLHAAAAAASRTLTASYPRMDVARSRPRVPSFYALEAIRAAEGSLGDLAAFERRAAAGPAARLGWPAPADPSRAVDAAEYDLATLEPALRQPAGAPRGLARYIVGANPHLARALRFRWRRWHRKWHPADGFVAGDDAAALELARLHGLGRHPHSPTALQRYAACPYQFFLAAMRRLRPREEIAPLERMDPSTRGALFHAAQFELFRELESENAPPWDPARLQPILDLADAALDRCAARFADNLAPAIPRVWRSEVEDVRVDLRGWARHAAAPGGEWSPHRFELAFGLADEGGRDERSSPDAVSILEGGLILRGSVDLVERSARRNTLRVVDHKTGKPPEPLPGYVGGGAVLQPLLYALAVESLLGEPVESGLLSYCTQRGGYTDVRIEATPTARQRIAQAVEIVSRAVDAGFLPAAPARGACGRCDYGPVCGPYEERRFPRKPTGPVEELTLLRRLP